MNKSISVLLAMFCLAVSSAHAKAMSSLILVTKQNQAEVGVKFQLSAERVSDTSVIVKMQVPRAGTLKELKRVSMDIGDYKPGISTSPMLYADLQTTQGKDGSLTVSFQLSPQMAEKCSILLGPLTPAKPTREYYSVSLQSFVTTKLAGSTFQKSSKDVIGQSAVHAGLQMGTQIVNGHATVKPNEATHVNAFARNLSRKTPRFQH